MMANTGLKGPNDVGLGVVLDKIVWGVFYHMHGCPNDEVVVDCVFVDSAEADRYCVIANEKHPRYTHWVLPISMLKFKGGV